MNFIPEQFAHIPEQNSPIRNLSTRPILEKPKDCRVSCGGYLAQLHYKTYVRKTQEDWSE